MLRPFKLLFAAAAFAGITSAAFAEAPPSCPGGGTATGTFSCTGPVTRPVCSEGPPWKCSITNTGTNAVDASGSGSGRGRLHGNLGTMVMMGN